VRAMFPFKNKLVLDPYQMPAAGAWAACGAANDSNNIGS
jgi:hypothetical protein